MSSYAARKNSLLPIEDKDKQTNAMHKRGAKKATKTDESTSEHGIESIL